MQDERNYGTAGGGTGGTGSGLGSSASGVSGSTGGSTGGMGGGSSAGGGNRVSGNIDQLKERADSMLEQAAEKLEDVAEKVDAAAGLIPKKGVGQQANSYGHTAADTLESVARWMRDNDTESLQRELGGLVATRPLSMMLLAVGAGFVAGKVLR